MNQYKSGKWTGEPKKKSRKSGIRDITQPVIAICMCAVGLGLSLVIGELPLPDKTGLTLSVSASGYNEAYAPTIVENTTNEEITAEETTVDYPEFDSLFTEIESSEDEDFDSDKYSTVLTSDQITQKLEQSAIASKIAEDNAYRSRNAGTSVNSGRKSLYLDYYYYNRTQTLNGTYNRLNTNGTPMSQYTTPSCYCFDENGIPTNYAYYIDGKATAYSSGGRTATGTHTYQGTVAVDPRIIPYGSEMWITSLDGKYVYGYCRAEDTGGFIYYRNGATVDLFMNSNSDAVSWGFRSVRIYVFPNYNK